MVYWSWSRAMELMFELVNYMDMNLCEFVNLCIWTYVNLRTHIFGLVWICDMNIYQCVWNLYCMWYIVLHVILCVSNFCIFVFFIFFWKRVKNVGTHVLKVKNVGTVELIVQSSQTHAGLRTWVPTFLMLRTWVPSNLLSNPRRRPRDT
jgi:hypothetical protein